MVRNSHQGSKICCGLNKGDREPASCKMTRAQCSRNMDKCIFTSFRSLSSRCCLLGVICQQSACRPTATKHNLQPGSCHPTKASQPVPRSVFGFQEGLPPRLFCVWLVARRSHARLFLPPRGNSQQVITLTYSKLAPKL